MPLSLTQSDALSHSQVGFIPVYLKCLIQICFAWRCEEESESRCITAIIPVLCKASPRDAAALNSNWQLAVLYIILEVPRLYQRCDTSICLRFSNGALITAGIFHVENLLLPQCFHSQCHDKAVYPSK